MTGIEGFFIAALGVFSSLCSLASFDLARVGMGILRFPATPNVGVDAYG